MKLSKEIISYFALPLIMLLACCSSRTTVVNKPLQKDTASVIYGCWVSRLDLSFKSRPDELSGNIQYVEDYKLRLDKNYTFELETRLTTNDIRENGTKVAGIYKIKSDTIFISTDGFYNKIEQYTYRLNGDTLWFRQIKKPFYNSSVNDNIFIRPILQYRWDRE